MPASEYPRGAGSEITRPLKFSRSSSIHGTALRLWATLRASSTMVFWCMSSRSAISSPTPHEVRRNVDLVAVDLDVPVQNDLARLRAGAGQAHAPHGVIQTALEHDDQVFAGGTLRARGLFKIATRNCRSSSP